MEGTWGERRSGASATREVHDCRDKPNSEALDRLAKLLRRAEGVGLYLNLTGLGCTTRRTCLGGTTSCRERQVGRAGPVLGGGGGAVQRQRRCSVTT